MKKVKLCKKCTHIRFANSSLCLKHFKEKIRLDTADRLKRKKERKLKTKKYQKSELKKWHSKCWKLMSERVRSKGADFQGYAECYTCYRKFLWKELHAGHWKHRVLDFDSRNLRSQCNFCNTYKGGMLDEYTLRLIRENGLEWVEKLRQDAAQHPGYKLEELKEIYIRLKSL